MENYGRIFYKINRLPKIIRVYEKYFKGALEI